MTLPAEGDAGAVDVVVVVVIKGELVVVMGEADGATAGAGSVLELVGVSSSAGDSTAAVVLVVVAVAAVLSGVMGTVGRCVGVTSAVGVVTERGEDDTGGDAVGSAMSERRLDVRRRFAGGPSW